jgi:hypothetical protein
MQMIAGHRQARAGFYADAIYGDVLSVARRLEGEGWTLDSVPHARADMGFAERALREGLPVSEVRLFGNRDGLFSGVEYFADLPYVALRKPRGSSLSTPTWRARDLLAAATASHVAAGTRVLSERR